MAYIIGQVVGNYKGSPTSCQVRMSWTLHWSTNGLKLDRHFTHPP